MFEKQPPAEPEKPDEEKSTLESKSMEGKGLYTYVCLHSVLCELQSYSCHSCLLRGLCNKSMM